MGTFSFPSSSGGINSPYYKTYKSLVNAALNTPDINYSPASATTYALTGVNIGKTITIGANATINASTSSNGSGPYASMFICDTLVLNGTIKGDASAAGTQASASGGFGFGGNGGTGIWIFARQITLNGGVAGTISANGGAGGNGTNNTGTSAYSAGQYGGSGMMLTNQYAGYGISPSTVGSSGTNNTGAASVTWSPNVYIPLWLVDLITNRSTNYSAYQPLYKDYSIFGGAGNSGGASYTTSAASSGGPAGASPVAAGSSPVSVTGTSSGAGGGGGGAGGVYILTENPIPSINLQAIGGNGGAGYGTSAGNGGCGGGGFVVQLCGNGSSAAVVNVNGGTSNATNNKSANGTTGQSYVGALV